jgi:hypothetical protein
MKSIILAGALFLAALTSKTFAADIKVSPLVLHAFETSFKGATDVQWSIVNHLYRAEFTQEGEKTIAFIAGDGTLVATSHYITVGELPQALQSSLVRRTITGSIMEVYEVQSEGQAHYYATVQHLDGKIVFKSASTGWYVYKKG